MTIEELDNDELIMLLKLEVTPNSDPEYVREILDEIRFRLGERND